MLVVTAFLEALIVHLHDGKTLVQATPLQTKPTEPRSSVIRNPPSKRGAGDGTPLRAFHSELRQYPAPTV